MERGWNFPVMVDSKTGKIKVTDIKSDIRQSIMILLSTVPGERLLHSDYGCNLHRFMFEPITYELVKAIREEVLRSIIKWEKRVYNVDVSVLHDVEDDSRLVITISYIIPEIREADNINYVFSLLEH
ncbi:MAG: GPW/gp25 family protein [Lachnospiraceae bacterium]|nr:GPW/gp25 family protein [Lachnospiraceae bacterium]